MRRLRIKPVSIQVHPNLYDELNRKRNEISARTGIRISLVEATGLLDLKLKNRRGLFDGKFIKKQKR